MSCLPAIGETTNIRWNSVTPTKTLRIVARLTEAVYPWPDALLTAFSLLAQLWMALKRWQCWLLWIVVDVLYVGFFAFQEYWLTAGLYGVFTALAVLGLREWRASRTAHA